MVLQERETGKKFYPDYLIEILFVAFVVIEITVLLAMAFPQGIGRQIDFSAQYRPKPEWYFLWLYQLVRYFPGRTAFFGTVVIPIASMVIFICIPYLDRGKHGRLTTSAIGMAVLFVAILFTLIAAFSP
ncbi:MAG: hypothetical protein ABR903_11140 [Thermodesulfovibrionales bacterium]|jgi:quinol-cytochrome oxidoreductase complex cytochrome b subunit